MTPAIPPDTSKWPKGGQITHNRAQAVDIGELTQFLEGLGYAVLQLEQRWRHVHGIVQLDDSQLFFKMASTPEIGSKTRNEVAWNIAVADPLLEISDGMLIVPKIRGNGFHNYNFFYLADYYTGEFTADHDPPRTLTITHI